MTTEANPDCTACQDNKWWVKNGPVRAREMERMRLEVKRMAARVAHLEWEREHEAWLRKDEQTWAQIKVREQAKALKILNEKLAGFHKKKQVETTSPYNPSKIYGEVTTTNGT